MFADIEIVSFDFLLGVFYGPIDEAMLDGNVFLHVKAIHEGFDTLALEDTEQIIFE